MRRRDALVLLAAALLSCARPAPGSGRRATVVRTPGPFSEVAIRGEFELAVELGADTHSVSIESDDNLLERITTATNGRRLVIEVDGQLAPTFRPRLRIAAPDLVLLRGVGAIDARIVRVRNARFQLDLDGSGESSVEGSTQKLKVHVSGSSRVHLEQLACEEALVHVSGDGSVDVASPRHLEVELHGSPTVTYAGKPQVESVIRDAGRLLERP